MNKQYIENTKKVFKEFRDLEVRSINQDEKTVELSFSSEDPYERYWGVEILDHSTTSVDMSRLNNAAPLLFNHNRDEVIGVVVSAKIADKRGIAVVRFGNSAKAKEVFSDVVDGIMKNVSVGYQIDEMILESEKDGMETYRVTSWRPFEISVVSIPADTTVGIGRGAEDPKESDVKIINKLNKKGEQNMNEEEKRVAEEAAKREARAAEKTRVREIAAIAKKHDMEEEGQKAIEEDTTVDEFRALVLQKIGSAKPVDTKANNVLDEKEVRAYSLGKAIRAALIGDWSEAQVEQRASQKVAKLLGKDARGFYVPHQVLERDLNTTGGAAIISTNDGGISFIDILKNKLVTQKLGAVVIGGLSGNVSVPKKTGKSTAYWINEEDNTTGSDLVLGMLPLTPKTVSAKTGYSRQMLLQGNIDVENLLMSDLAEEIALAIDAAGIAGTGLDGQPKGILYTTGIGAVDCSTALGGINFNKVVDLETAIANGNADVENMHYVSGASVTGKLKKIPVESGHPEKLLKDGEVNGYNHTRSNQVPANTLIFGDFSQLLYGLWGGLDIMIDPYAKADSAGVVIRAFQSVDVAIRHPESFSATNNIDQ
ncbi:MAG TPA: phage major capsid protein [Sulfurovum sp. UBA12169]|nr:MAG TPA: phage major capsid protein [Sulfurovum sp. UBA12169]